MSPVRIGTGTAAVDPSALRLAGVAPSKIMMGTGAGAEQVWPTAVRYFDDFNRTNGALTTPWLSRSGSVMPVINANAVQHSTGSGNTNQYAIHNQPLPTDDADITVKIKTPVGQSKVTTTYFYVFFHAQPQSAQNDDWIVAVFSGAANANGIYTLSSSGMFTRRTTSTTSFVTGDTLTLRCRGTAYSILRNGTLISSGGSWTDSGNVVPRDANHRGWGFAVQSFTGYGFAVDEVEALQA